MEIVNVARVTAGGREYPSNAAVTQILACRRFDYVRRYVLVLCPCAIYLYSCAAFLPR